MYSYIFSIRVGAQWTTSTGCPIDERAFQAEKIAEEDGGHGSGGNDKILPFGRFESAIEMPAMWYLFGQTKRYTPERYSQWKKEKPILNVKLLK
jgi:hypothetical protein